MKRTHSLKPNQLFRIRILQVAGIALIILSALNALLLDSIGMLVNLMLFFSGVFLLWLSFQLWQYLTQRTTRH